MTITREEREEEALARAAETLTALPAAARTTAASEFLADHPSLGARVQSQLHALGVLDKMLSEPLPGPTSGSWPAPPEIGHYRLLQVLGRGGMGTVYLARSTRDDGLVAVKLIDAATCSESAQKRFDQEASIALRARHPNLVTVYERGAEHAYSYYAMEFVPGVTLAELIERLRTSQRRGRFELARIVDEQVAEMARRCGLDLEDLEPPLDLGVQAESHFPCVARIVAEVADGLGYLHDRKVLHRDVKPSNILLSRSLLPRVADFGLARDLSPRSGRLAPSGLTTGMLGTLDYMSPEMLAEGAGAVDHRTDIYSLGVTLYQLLTLQVPHRTTSTLRSLQMASSAIPLAPRKLSSDIPRELETITLKAIEKRPRDRYQSMRELAEDLRRFLRYEPILARAPSWPRRAVRHAVQHRAQVLLAAVVLLVVVAVWLARSITSHQQRAKLTGEARELMRQERFVDAGRLLHAAALLRDDQETAHLLRMAEGTFAVPFWSTPSGATVEAWRIDDTTGAARLEQDLGRTGDTEAGLQAMLGVGTYRIVVHKEDFGLGEYLLNVRWKLTQPGLRAQLRPRAEVVADMVEVPGGRYPVGRAAAGLGTPLDLEPQTVELEAFYLDRTEVSNADYRRFVEAAGARAPWRDGTFGAGEERLPVVGITWEEANAYAEWRGKRLPTQHEWEAAARGPTGRTYPWGDEWRPERAHLGQPSQATPSTRPRRFVPVDAQTQDVSFCGAVHMTGNAREWVYDPWIPRTDVLPSEAWQFPAGNRVIKGDSAFQPLSPFSARASARTYFVPSRTVVDVGFRCARSKRE